MSNFEEDINRRVILWYENDRGLYHSALNRAQNVLNNVATEDDIPEHVQGVWSLEQTRKYRLADNLRESFNQHMARIKDTTEPCGVFGSMAQEMITVSSSAINWEEIAERFIETAKEQS